MARKQHTAAEEYEAAREKRCASGSLDPKQQEACKHERDGPQNYLPWWYVLVAWPEGITVWVIVGTGFVIGWQAWETRKAAKATLKLTKLQEAQLRQWVALDEWEGHSDHFNPVLTTRTTYWMTFWVTNPTKMPLTLKKVNITVPDGKPVLRSEGDDFVISPENGFRVQWPTIVADKTTMKRLVEGTWRFSLVIDVDFVDVLGESNHSQFAVGCKCGTTSCEAEQYHSRQPT